LRVALIALVGVAFAQDDCEKLGSDVDLAHDHERVTPDYVKGPWFLMPEEFPFDSWTKRPRMVEIMQLLGSVAKTVDEIEEAAKQARASKQGTEEFLHGDGQRLVGEMERQMEDIVNEERAKNAFLPTQTRITNLVGQVLAPKLMYLSQLQATSADIRFPFAERLAEYTADLLNLLRAKAEATAALKGYRTEAEIIDELSNYIKMGQDMKKKIDDEVSVATKLLNSNSKAIDDTTKYLQTVEEQIRELRANLTVLLDLGGKFTPNHKVIAQVTLSNERSLLRGLAIADEAQDDMVEDIKGQKESVIATLHHVASLMKGLVEQNQAPVENALEPELAMQTVTGDCME